MYLKIESLVNSLKSQGMRNDYIVSSVKEFLQGLVLNYIYNNKEYNQNLIFTGGTCLRFCFGLPRLSEDLDFDFETELKTDKLGEDIERHLRDSLKIQGVNFAIKGKHKKIYLKFPILNSLGLSYNNSHILFLKVETSAMPEAPRVIEVTPVNREGLYFYVRRYSLPDLMAGKINAFLTRTFFKGKTNEIDFKGRDAFDLIWYMGQNIQPNQERLRKLLAGTVYNGYKWDEILDKIREKLNNIKKQHMEMDLRQFVQSQDMLENFLNNYMQIFNQYCKSIV